MTTPPGLAREIDILDFVVRELAIRRRAALVTIVGLDGPFSRPVGAQLGVAFDRRFVGSVSGGCLETAVVEAAVAAMQKGESCLVRFGKGSPFIDVRLPCGGGLDLFIDVRPNAKTLQEIVTRLRARQTAELEIDFSFAVGPGAAASAALTSQSDTPFVRRFLPCARIVVAGRGWEVVSMARSLETLDCDLVIASQESATLDECASYVAERIPLKTPSSVPDLRLDRHSAFVSMFHEHEWEPQLLLSALKSPAFYVGALGSRKTHEQRKQELSALGATSAEIARIRAPIGLFSARDPALIALSAAAEVFLVRQALFDRDLRS